MKFSKRYFHSTDCLKFRNYLLIRYKPTWVLKLNSFHSINSSNIDELDNKDIQNNWDIFLFWLSTSFGLSLLIRVMYIPMTWNTTSTWNNVTYRLTAHFFYIWIVPTNNFAIYHKYLHTNNHIHIFLEWFLLQLFDLWYNNIMHYLHVIIISKITQKKNYST